MTTSNPIGRRHIAGLLREAADMIDKGDSERAAWRIADACGLLRQSFDIEAKGHHDLAGYAEPTGLGYELPYPAIEEIRS